MYSLISSFKQKLNKYHLYFRHCIFYTRDMKICKIVFDFEEFTDHASDRDIYVNSYLEILLLLGCCGDVEWVKPTENPAGAGYLANEKSSRNAPHETTVPAALVHQPCQECIIPEQFSWAHLKPNSLSNPLTQQKTCFSTCIPRLVTGTSIHTVTPARN